ncbi:conserved protein of unknown function [Ectopseudomonas oleovorans]|uniref:Uncharacterized protein n=1 Tax=Ectopseudomonas oleovorans TaxID=301 RepID=A0A653B984_ECTOL|nr:conserved protein of unknown function [Pseudomonas oleovorans]
MPGQQLALCVGQRFELRADLVLAIGALAAVHDLGPQQQAEGLGHQHHLDRQVTARRDGLGMVEADATLGQRDLAGRADIAQQALRHGLAEQVDALVDHLQVVGQGAVALADVTQQVLGLEVHQVQVAEQVEQRRRIVKFVAGLGFGACQQGEFQCDRIFDAIVFAAIIYIVCRHGEPMKAVVVEDPVESLASWMHARRESPRSCRLPG